MLPALLLLAGVATATPLNAFHALLARQALPSASAADLGIPAQCVAQCGSFVGIYNACSSGAVTDCLQVCEPANWTGFKACATCVLTSEGGTAAQVDDALAPVEQACALTSGTPPPGGNVGGPLSGASSASAALPTGSGVGTVGTVGPASSPAAPSSAVNAGHSAVGAASSANFGTVGPTTARASATGASSASASASPSAQAKSAGSKVVPSAALIAAALLAVFL
ncbi:hypothetical protein Q8F55_003580 [Vanrija albida]|uniref:Extracellular membrane protein CFEM domain-containing protein n=1 Tax=Vanrija albida TaxID=181172 RepID=A0ABR3Q4J2_9TREE